MPPGFIPAAPRPAPPETGVMDILGLFDLNPPVLEMLWKKSGKIEKIEIQKQIY